MKEFCRKGHMTRGGKRWLALLMSVCLIGTMLPISAKAETDGTQKSGYEQEEENTSVSENDAADNASEDGEDAADNASEDGEDAADNASEDGEDTADNASEDGEDAADNASEDGEDAADNASEDGEDAADNASEDGEDTADNASEDGEDAADNASEDGEDAADNASEPEDDPAPSDDEKDKAKDKETITITAWEWIDEEEYLDPETGSLSLPGASKEHPAYFDDVISFLPTRILAMVENTEDTEAEEEDEPITLGDWECDNYPEEGAYTGSYTFTAALPEGYALSGEAKALTVLVELGGAQMYASTETGDFTVTGGTLDTDYSYADGVLTIKTNTQITISGTTTTDRIEVKDGVDANITLDGVKIDVSSSDYIAAFKIADNSTGNVTITLADGSENTLKSGWHCAGLQKNGSGESIGKLTIQGGSNGTGKLTAIDGYHGAGIGGGENGSGSNITIRGGTVTAIGGGSAAGIGGGVKGSGSNIEISGGTVTAEGGYAGAGIGGGENGSGSNIEISGGTVTAEGGYAGAGIGGGENGSGSNIEISGGTVTAEGGYAGAGIGSGVDGTGSNILIKGGTVTATGGVGSYGNMGGAGIGGGHSNSGGRCTGSNITIESGTVTASSVSGAGIGGGSKGSGSSITISGGTVTATSETGAGIGGGYGGGGYGGDGSNIKISGGTVTATSGDGAGIGGGSGGDGDGGDGSNITISGGSVKASGANKIGGGSGKEAVIPTSDGTTSVYLLTIANPDSAEVLIDGGSYTPVNHKAADGTDTNLYAYLTGKTHEVKVGEKTCLYVFDSENSTFAVAPLTVYPTNGGALTYGTDYTYESNLLTIKSTTPVTIANVDPSEATTDCIEVESGVSANITLAGVNIDVSGTGDVITDTAGSAAFKIEDDSTGNVTITLADDSVNTLRSGRNCAGLQKNGAYISNDKGKLTIQGGTGTVTATGVKHGAGIGGGIGGSGSNIEISGGTVTATGGIKGAGIGGGSGGSGSNIKISGGTVTATSNGSGAGIGGGNEGTGSNITIEGGTVTAKSSSEDAGAGIGGGQYGSGSNITIIGGTVTATGSLKGAGIGGGAGCDGSNIEISGGTVTAIGSGTGASIGGGLGCPGSNITISGGTVTATNSDLGAGIGGGWKGNGTNITISGGTVTATSSNGAGIGSGKDGTGSSITMNGDVVLYTSSVDSRSTFTKGVVYQGVTVSGSGNSYTLTGGVGTVYGNPNVSGFTEPTGSKLGTDFADTDNITVTVSDVDYTGAVAAPTATVTVNKTALGGEKTLVQGTDYTVSVSSDNKTDVGEKQATIVAVPGSGNVGENTGHAFNVKTVDLSVDKIEMSLSGIQDGGYVYNTNEIKPVPVVTLKRADGSEYTLIKDTDYTVDYSNNTNAYELLSGDDGYESGKAPTVTVTAKDNGNFTGSRSMNFKIHPADMPGFTITPYSGSYDGASHSVFDSITPVDGFSDYTVYYSTDNKETWSTTVPTITNAGTKDFYVKAIKPNYKDWISEKQTAKVTPVALASSMISFNDTNHYYTGQEVKPGITVKDSNRDLASGTDYTVSYTNNTSVSADDSKAVVTITAANGNYTGSASAEFRIEYAQETYLNYCTVSGTAGNDGWYSSDVTIQNKAGTNSAWGALQFSGSPTGTFADSYTVSAEGITNATIWFKQTTTGYIGSDSTTVKIDKTAPVWTENRCGISVKENWWKSLLNTISFGLFYKETVDVKVCASDSLSGVAAYYYLIDSTSGTVKTAEELDALSFTEYAGSVSGQNPSVIVTSLAPDGNYIVYAYAVDAVGNRSAYVCSEGVVVDSTAPTISNIVAPSKEASTLTDTTAQISFRGSEAGTYFYMVRKKGEAAPASITEFAEEKAQPDEKGMSVWTAKGGISYAAMKADGSNTVTLTGLNAYTEYTLYLAAVDQAGNSTGTTVYYSQSFKTCKTVPRVADADMPEISGTYGQTVADMILTPGTAKVGSTVINGTWVVTDSNKTGVPVVGTTATYQVTFTPDASYNDRYDIVIVAVKPTVAPRSLTADDVSITEVAGSFTYGYGAQIEPSVTFGAAPATGASGVYVTDSGAAITTADIKVTYSNNINAGTAKVILTGQGNYTGTVERTFTIDKADGKNIATMNGSYTDNGQTYTYTVEAVPADGAAVSGLEYLMLPQGTALTGSETWQTSNVFAGITPNTVMVFYARMKATSNNHAGEASSKTVNFEKLTPSAPTLNYTVDDSDPDSIALTIIPVPGAEYSFDGGSSFTDDNTKGGFATDATINLAIRMKETDTHNASEATELTVTLTAYDITVANGSAAVNGNTVTKGYPGQTVTVTAANRSGYNVTGWTVVSGGVTLSVSTDKKTATFTMPEEAVSLRAEYRKNNSSSGGGSGNSGGSSGGGSGSTGNSGNTGGSTDTGNGNTNPGTEKPTVTPGTPAQGTNPAPGENPAPGTGNGSKPGSKPVTNTGETTEAPFIKGENGKEGWDVIRDEVNQTQEGKTVTVDMNGSAVVPGNVLDEIKGKDITIVFDMGGGITWSVNGQNITADRVGDIDFTVKTGTNTIPVDVINNVTGERNSRQLSLSYDGEFGFTAVLSINVDAENAGLYANLFYYNEKTGEIEFICYDEIAADGTAELVFTHASDYVIVIDSEPMDKGADEADGDKAEASGTGNDSTQSGDGSTQNGTEAADSAWNPLWLILIGAVVIVIGLGVFLAARKEKSENE